MARVLNLFKNLIKISQHPIRCYSNPKEASVKEHNNFPSSQVSKELQRSKKEYFVLRSTIEQFCKELKLKLSGEFVGDKYDFLEQKFKILAACATFFNYDVPNSQIYQIKTVKNIIQFYETSVAKTHFDALKSFENLPLNLYIHQHYTRFTPDTDTKFNSKTAYPKSSSIISGLKYRDKYKGHFTKRSWPT